MNIEWLTNRRSIDILERTLEQQRRDFEARLGEKDLQIRQLKLELSNLKYQPMRPGRDDAPAPIKWKEPEDSLSLDWNGELQRMLRLEKQNIQTYEEEGGV